jgi:hypothetical protein
MIFLPSGFVVMGITDIQREGKSARRKPSIPPPLADVYREAV